MAIAILTRAVIVPASVLERLWPGGEAGAAPNLTYRCDGHLAALDFRSNSTWSETIDSVAATP